MGSAEQSNTSILFGDQLFLKLFRRLQPEENPDVEIGRFLTEVAHFSSIPNFLGEISTSQPGSEKTTVAMLQRLVPNQGDGWQWVVNEVSHWLAGLVGRAAPSSTSAANFHGRRVPVPKTLEGAQAALEAAALLGRRTAEMHLALSSSEDLPAFVPELMTATDLARDAERVEAQIKSTLDTLKLKLTVLDDAACDAASLLISRRPELIRRARAIADLEPSGQRVRIHGDFHLGQTLRTAKDAQTGQGGDFIVIDFEGEPARPIDERRRKQSPLKDVAGMIRSFSYAAYSAVDQAIAGADQAAATRDLNGWAQLWYHAASAQFLWAYTDVAARNQDLLPTAETAQVMLEAYLLEKALYEVLYELNHRPRWLQLPIGGILAL
jgi:maltose alpha-D-glucosyltransferase/alpha-amylase